jgi:hypothetical protein
MKEIVYEFGCRDLEIHWCCMGRYSIHLRILLLLVQAADVN